jgi:hypothetical protein
MTRLFLLLLIIVAALITGCPKEEVMDTRASDFHGTWIRVDGVPGGALPADTLWFSSKGGKDVLYFRFASIGGANWPADVETEYQFENNKLTLKDFSGGTNDFIPVESFQWITRKKEFSARLYKIVHFMSADYRVTYRKVN